MKTASEIIFATFPTWPKMKAHYPGWDISISLEENYPADRSGANEENYDPVFHSNAEHL
jgi:hypothetical protein